MFIGELSKRSGVKASTIRRWYHDHLLPPIPGGITSEAWTQFPPEYEDWVRATDASIRGGYPASEIRETWRPFWEGTPTNAARRRALAVQQRTADDIDALNARQRAIAEILVRSLGPTTTPNQPTPNATPARASGTLLTRLGTKITTFLFSRERSTA